MDSEIKSKVAQWKSATFDSHTKQKIEKLEIEDPKQLEESFYKNLEFGTGGMRGVMGVGTNRINKYTLGKNTQGLSSYLLNTFPNEQVKVAIAFDCRHNSKTLAKVVADVFSANNIKVFLFEDLRPTPELSFAVKYLDCHCGIVLTASHNPPEYNGYKVYWQDGGQLVPPQDNEIIKKINEVEYENICFEAKPELIEFIGENIDDAFTTAAVNNGSFNKNKEAKDKVNIVFTSLHGTSITSLPQTLEKAGFKNVAIVQEQKIPDGDFPTVESPNPEEPAALKMALELAEKTNGDIVIGTDPDSDRVGIAVRDTNNKLVLLNGNQTMIVMTNYLLKKWQSNNKINGNQFVGSTIVSTTMMPVLANTYGVDCKIGLTGFKWIAKMVLDHSELEFIGGGEESFGYMVGDFVRDKDAITSALLACEIVAEAKANNSSFYEELLKLYVEHGFYKERLISITKKGIEGEQEIKQMMIDARETPFKTLGGSKVVSIEDYQSSESIDLLSGQKSVIDIPKSNVLIYFTEDGSKVALRPSGTEPKIKFYISVNASLENINNAKQVEQALENKIDNILKDMKLM